MQSSSADVCRHLYAPACGGANVQFTGKNTGQPVVVIVGAGINGLVCANYLQRGGCKVTIIERAGRVGGACVSAEAIIGRRKQAYALGASVLGLMQRFVFEQTGLAARLPTFVPTHPKLVHFPGDKEPARIYRDAAALDRELADKWGESGDVAAFRADEAKVIDFLQQGYVDARPPSLDDANDALGRPLTELWIAGSARKLLDHYFTSERSKIYMAMTVTESGPVSLDEAFSAFTLPLMDSGSVFGGYYGFIKGGIWRICEELDRINGELGVTTLLDASVVGVDTDRRRLRYRRDDGNAELTFDHLVFATDPLSASRLAGSPEQRARTEKQRFQGSSGKLNLIFRSPVRWKYGSNASDSDVAFRFLFAVDSLAEFESATLAATGNGRDYVPGYAQIYCEGAAMRQLGVSEPFDRLAVFFKNLSLRERGEYLGGVEQAVKTSVLQLVDNPEDCVWSRLLTPADLKAQFLFPGGNLDHTMLVGGQTYFDRSYADDRRRHFYRFGSLENVSICGAGTYPCGSVAGTPGYMCSQQYLRNLV
jgi:phytoene dehydrogenase-like protein